MLHRALHDSLLQYTARAFTALQATRRCMTAVQTRHGALWVDVLRSWWLLALESRHWHGLGSSTFSVARSSPTLVILVDMRPVDTSASGIIYLPRRTMPVLSPLCNV